MNQISYCQIDCCARGVTAGDDVGDGFTCLLWPRFHPSPSFGSAPLPPQSPAMKQPPAATAERLHAAATFAAIRSAHRWNAGRRSGCRSRRQEVTAVGSVGTGAGSQTSTLSLAADSSHRSHRVAARCSLLASFLSDFIKINHNQTRA